MVIPTLRDSSMQGIFRQVAKDDEKAPLAQGLNQRFSNELIVDLQGLVQRLVCNLPCMVQVGMQFTSNQCYLMATVRDFGHLYMT